MTLNKRIENYILWLNRLKAVKRRTTALVLALSLVVSGNVFWLMKSVGTALTEEPLCGQTEHTHTDDCYEKELVCELDHEHTDECYETRLVCGMEEHVHTDACYIVADLIRENKADWEKTLPQTTGIYSSDLMNCAASQIGYAENSDGYTRYGDWYGNPTADWNVMFVSFCMHYVGISNDQIPSGSGCWAWQVKLEESGLISDMSVMPMPGDILLTDNDGDGKCDRAGIIADVTEGIISTIEGDVEGKVGTCTYSAEDSTIYGYISVNSLNINTDDSGDAAIENQNADAEAPATVEYSATTESGIEVKATAPEGAFPEGVTMSARDVDDEEVISRAENAVDEDKVVKGSIAVDITFTDSEGNETEPLEGFAVEVNIIIPENKQLDANDYQLFHIGDEGAEEVKGAVVSQSEAQFTAEGFSIYVVTATGNRSEDKVHAWISNAGMGPLNNHRSYDPVTGKYGDYIVNDARYPYILRVGDTITIIGHNENSAPHFIVENNDSGWHTMDIDYTETVNGNDATLVITAVASTGWTANPYYNPGDTNVDPNYDNDESIRDSVRVRLEGTDEIFYIRVDEYSDEGPTIDFDNVPVYNNNSDNIWNYWVRVGQTVTVAGTPNPYGDNWPYLSNEDNPNGWIITNNSSYQMLDNNRRQLTIPAEIYRNGIDNIQVISMYTPDGMKKVRIIETVDGAIDHADIEIADGGVYTNVQIEGGDNGELYKTVTEYQSFVYDVNYSELLDASGNPVQFYSNSNNYAPLATSRFIGGKNNEGDFNDYWSDYRFMPGDSQYELTSKYTCPPGKLFDEGPIRWSDKRFFYQDVKGATFDVELQIIPKHEQKFIWDADANGGAGDWVPVPGENVEYDIQYNLDGGKYRVRTDGGEWSELKALEAVSAGGIVEYKNEVFHLGEQAVIDAYNKCPNHSGLDFTVHHDLATIQFTASKELIGRPLQDQEFEFKIYPSLEEAISTATPAPTGVATARNDANGKIVFENVEFENVVGEQTFTYYMKEVRGDDDTIVYDPVIYKIVIDVNKVYPGAGPDGKDLVVPVDISSFRRLKANGDPAVDSDYLSADKFMFQNITDSFTLPNTGGGGIVPFLAVSTVLIGGAITLLMLRRRKEVDL